ncbi:MAG: DUF4332 domain-containing protein [Bacteroidota bacterium]
MGKKDEAVPAPVSAETTTEKNVASSNTNDDLRIVEGIGPKIAELLHNAGINTWAALAGTEVAKLKAILSEAGKRYATHNPATWPKQAELAAAGKFEELKDWQDKLDGGKEVKSAATEEE